MVWCHAPEPGNLLAIQDLALRLCRSRPGLSVLITIPKQATPSDLPQSGNSKILIDFAPEDHPTSTKLFLDHWQPDTCIWAWGRLMPNLIIEMADRGCPMFLIDGDSDGFEYLFRKDPLDGCSAVSAASSGWRWVLVLLFLLYRREDRVASEV